MNPDTYATQVLRIVEQRGHVHSRELTAGRIPRATLMRLVRAGRLEQVARGMYALPGRRHSRQHVLAEVAARSSRGVFCLLTALRFHGIDISPSTTTWLAIPNKARAPRSDRPPLKIVRFSGAALAEGVEQHVVDGVTIRVYSVAKTVADCFKFRNTIGLDLAVEALHEARRRKLATLHELQHYARVCRVTEVMRPHLDRR
jgi:predicted transcriptional regulator of viral defense system